MLTKAHAIYEYDRSHRKPDRLNPIRHADYPARIERAIAVYAAGVGKRRHDLHLAVEEIFDDDPHYHELRLAAFCRLLDERSVFDRGQEAVALRRKVFTQAAQHYPLVSEPQGLFGNSRDNATAAIEAELSRPWQEIEDALFNDVESFQRLKAFDASVSARDLLNRYNVAQVQACLYDAERLTILATEHFKEILRYAKLARLMHSISRLEDGRYRFEFDGPASVHRNTRIYGIRMARMIPGLLACRGWELTAYFSKDGRPSTFYLDHNSKLKSPVQPANEYDSNLEADFAEKWGERVREGWSLTRESEVLSVGQKVFVPDFRLEHTDGRRVHLEIVGFWEPGYLEAKRQTLALFDDHSILIAVAESKVSDFEGLDIPAVSFAQKLSPANVTRGLEQYFSA